MPGLADLNVMTPLSRSVLMSVSACSGILPPSASSAWGVVGSDPGRSLASGRIDRLSHLAAYHVGLRDRRESLAVGGGLDLEEHGALNGCGPPVADAVLDLHDTVTARCGREPDPALGG